jgi:hypothetical protein
MFIQTFVVFALSHLPQSAKAGLDPLVFVKFTVLGYKSTTRRDGV